MPECLFGDKPLSPGDCFSSARKSYKNPSALGWFYRLETEDLCSQTPAQEHQQKTVIFIQERRHLLRTQGWMGTQAQHRQRINNSPQRALTQLNLNCSDSTRCPQC